MNIAPSFALLRTPCKPLLKPPAAYRAEVLNSPRKIPNKKSAAAHWLCAFEKKAAHSKRCFLTSKPVATLLENPSPSATTSRFSKNHQKSPKITGPGKMFLPYCHKDPQNSACPFCLFGAIRRRDRTSRFGPHNARQNQKPLHSTWRSCPQA